MWQDFAVQQLDETTIKIQEHEPSKELQLCIWLKEEEATKSSSSEAAEQLRH